MGFIVSLSLIQEGQLSVTGKVHGRLSKSQEGIKCV